MSSRLVVLGRDLLAIKLGFAQVTPERIAKYFEAAAASPAASGSC
jgi:hypothetical protein